MNVTCTQDPCPIALNSKCVFYESTALPYTGINTNDSLQVCLQKIEDVISTIGGNAVWGSITGTVTDQTDLTSYLSSTYQTSLSGVQGDIIYFSGVDTLANLAKNTTATRYLSNTGTSNNPAWSQVSLTDGVTGVLPVSNGGTGVSTIAAKSVWVANSLDTIVAITPAASQSIRINSGNTAWEAFTPIGGSTGSVDNALLRADGGGGATLQTSSVIISDAAQITMGTASLIGNRTLNAVNSTGDAALTISAQGQVLITPTGNFEVIATNNVNLTATSLVQVSAANIALLNPTSNYGSGTKVVFVANATVNPSTNPVGGGILYSNASDSSKPYWRTPGGTVYDLTSGGGITNSAANGQVTISDGTNIFGDTALTWDSTNNALTIGSARFHTNGATDNIFCGLNSGNFTLSGASNTAIGQLTLNALTTGFQNTAIGREALSLMVSGAHNTAIGAYALNIATGSHNTAVGNAAGVVLTTGSNNTILGDEAGGNLTTGTGNVLIGYDVDAQSATDNYQLSIQNAIYGLGNSAVATSISSGNLGFWATSWGTNAARVVSIGKGTAPTTSITDGIQLFAVDSSDANATLGLYLEQSPEATGTFTQTHRLKILINGTEYWLSLDQV